MRLDVEKALNTLTRLAFISVLVGLFMEGVLSIEKSAFFASFLTGIFLLLSMGIRRNKTKIENMK